MNGSKNINEPSRPMELPDLATAAAAIERMRTQLPVDAVAIRAIVEAAEFGIEQARQFDVRWAADMAAIAYWRAARPDRALIWPDHADLVVWLLSVIEGAPVPPNITALLAKQEALAHTALHHPATAMRETAARARDAIGSLLTQLHSAERRAYSAEQALALAAGQISPARIEGVLARHLATVLGDRFPDLIPAIVADLAHPAASNRESVQ